MAVRSLGMISRLSSNTSCLNRLHDRPPTCWRHSTPTYGFSRWINGSCAIQPATMSRVSGKTIQAEPFVVSDFGPYLLRAAKIVGSSMDFVRLAECETVMREALAQQASVARSQPYYLDVTAPDVDKGTVIDVLSNRLAVPPAAIAVLCDMENDLAMFRKAGLSIAMGNASTEVKRQSNYVTDSNSENGFARAIGRYILDAPRNERIA
jgi:hydroxymethylpyrimidine pyrophosphatase-like HAD family hydrolase